MQSFILNPDLSLKLASALAEKGEVAFIPLLHDVVSRTISVNCRGQTMFGSDDSCNISIGHVFVSLHSSGHAEIHQLVFSEDHHLRRPAFLKVSFESADPTRK